MTALRPGRPCWPPFQGAGWVTPRGVSSPVPAPAPGADPDVCRSLGADADDVVCLRTPERLGAVGLWYEDFSQTTDAEVRDLLALARPPPPARGPARLHDVDRGP